MTAADREALEAKLGEEWEIVAYDGPGDESYVVRRRKPPEPESECVRMYRHLVQTLSVSDKWATAYAHVDAFRAALSKERQRAYDRGLADRRPPYATNIKDAEAERPVAPGASFATASAPGVAPSPMTRDRIMDWVRGEDYSAEVADAWLSDRAAAVAAERARWIERHDAAEALVEYIEPHVTEHGYGPTQVGSIGIESKDLLFLLMKYRVAREATR